MNEHIMAALLALTATAYQLNSRAGFSVNLEYSGNHDSFCLTVFPKNHKCWKEIKHSIVLTEYVAKLNARNLKDARDALLEAHKRCITGESLTDLDTMAYLRDAITITKED